MRAGAVQNVDKEKSESGTEEGRKRGFVCLSVKFAAECRVPMGSSVLFRCAQQPIRVLACLSVVQLRQCILFSLSPPPLLPSRIDLYVWVCGGEEERRGEERGEGSSSEHAGMNLLASLCLESNRGK